MITITLTHGLGPEAEQWLAKNIGPRMHYIHNSIGGQGWIAKAQYEQEERIGIDGDRHITQRRVWKLTLEDERFASWFLLKFPQ